MKVRRASSGITELFRDGSSSKFRRGPAPVSPGDILKVAVAVMAHPDLIEDFMALNETISQQGSMLKFTAMLNDIFIKAPDLKPIVVSYMTSPAVAKQLARNSGPGIVGELMTTLFSNTTTATDMITVMSDPQAMAVFIKENKTDPMRAMHVIFGSTPALVETWDNFMEPTWAWSLRAGIIGNILITAAVCALTSVKSQSLLRQKHKQKSSLDMEKAMRKEVTESELKKHAVPGDLWIAVDGMVCDITDFASTHPGGADLLLEHAGDDASEEFKEVGHSSFATDLIKARMVGILVEDKYVAGRDQGGAGAGLLDRIKRRAAPYVPAQVLSLFTKEDPFNIHKLLGVYVIAHYITRWVFVLQGWWLLGGQIRDPMLFGPDWFSLISVWVHLLLQITSFQFVLPRNRVLGKPMLWQEWRMHNLIFVSRSLVAFTCSWVNMKYVTSTAGEVACSLVCFAATFGQLYFADVASRALRDSKHESLTASWPLWEGCPVGVERFMKFYYSIAINQLTATSIGYGMQGASVMMANFAGIVILQTDSFSMTLVRKNIISTASFHFYYLWNMWHIVFMIQHTHGRLLYEFMGAKEYWLDVNLTLWGIPLAVYICRYLGLSKYGCWLGFMVKVLCMEVTEWKHYTWLCCPAVWSVWALGQMLVSGYVFEYRVRRFLEGGRAKPLVLRSRERLTKTLHRLCFDMPWGYACGLMPGQHIRVLAPNISKDHKTWNNAENPEVDAEDISRSYTPISSPDSKIFEILVKYYPKDSTAGFPEGGRASTYLVEKLKIGEEALVSGPHGQRIYFGNGLFEVEVGKPKMRPRIVVVLAGGSGITPALSVLREIQAETRRKVFKSEALRLMDYECEVGVEAFHILHVNHEDEEALPLSFYEDQTQEQQLVRVEVCNLATREKAENQAEPISNLEQRDNQLKWQVRHGKLTSKLAMAVLPPPGDDTLVVACGPHNFIVSLCQPLLRDLGYKSVIPMW